MQKSKEASTKHTLATGGHYYSTRSFLCTLSPKDGVNVAHRVYLLTVQVESFGFLTVVVQIFRLQHVLMNNIIERALFSIF